MPKTTIIILILAVCILFASCRHTILGEETTGQQVELPETGLPCIFEYDTGERQLKSGKIICTITDARLINNINDLENLDGFTEDANILFIDDHDEIVLKYPDWINENGEFIEGAYLLLVDISVTSNGAESYTRHDINEFGDAIGMYDDPYLFRADSLVYLQDTHYGTDGIMTQEDTDGTKYTNIAAWGIDYFSERNRRSENPNVFRLSPGDTIAFHLGFLISDITEKGEMDLGSLYLTKVMGDKNQFIIHLNLSQEEE